MGEGWPPSADYHVSGLPCQRTRDHRPHFLAFSLLPGNPLYSGAMSAIRFGTDGWRGIIAEDFTFANARVVAHAIARYVVRGEDARKGVLIGYDHRYGSDRFAAAVAETISATGTPVWLADKPCPTPAISLLVRQSGAAGGIVITASHNPYRWNGIKYKASYCRRALPSIVALI